MSNTSSPLSARVTGAGSGGHGWVRLALPVVVLAMLSGCANFNSDQFMQKTRDVASRSADAVSNATSKGADRMKAYLAEKDVLKSFTDAGEHGESGLLELLSRAGIGKSGGGRAAGGGGAVAANGWGKSAAKDGNKLSSAAQQPLDVPDQYGGAFRWPLDAGIISSEFGARWGGPTREWISPPMSASRSTPPANGE